VVVHDGFSSYDQYRQCRHAQCNAHILRELNYVIETSKPQRAMQMKVLLREIKAAVEKAHKGGRKRLPPSWKRRFLREYGELIEIARKVYGTLRRKKGRTKKSKVIESVVRAAARKLTRRLDAKQDEILLFMHDFTVPLDNNQAEPDLRMLKVKQKISGCFEEWCRLRSYISTMKKQGRGVMDTIKSVFAGTTILPALRC
jgi:transposase